MPAPCDRPPDPLPEPLRGAETGTFTHRTITVRFPAIARRTLKENSSPLARQPLPAQALARLEALIGEIPHAPLRPIQDPGAPDEAGWARYLEPYLGLDWLQPPWLLVETYFYRRILEATGFFQPGPGQGRDPFALPKRQALDGSAEALRSLDGWLGNWICPEVEPCGGEILDRGEKLARLLHLNLWANQADLSMAAFWSGEARQGYQDAGAQVSQLLVDDTEAVVAALFSRPRPRRVDFIPDNAGLELIFDLVVSDYLLSSGIAEEVRFHLKAHPTFVSDAVIRDVQQTIDFLASRPEPRVARMGDRLRRSVAAGRLRLVDHFYWTSPLPAWEMPADLRQELSGAQLLIFKGDANYRRLLGDLYWPFTTPFAEIVCYTPAPLAALRVLKAELIAGLPPGQAAEVARQDPDWMVDGHWGVIQFTG